MVSPFPGMDPYLEVHWPDVQTSLIVGACEVLNQRLPDDLVARANERAAMVVDPLSVALDEPMTERFIEITDLTGECLVTVIEFVSPTNKIGKGIEAFVQTRDELMAAGVNVVEIDLNRTGNWQRLLLPYQCPPKVVSTYRAVIRLGSEEGAAHFYPISLRQALPALQIPLRKDDAPVKLALQPLVEQAYKNGRYARTIDYSRSPEPPLEPGSATWADELLRSAGKRF